MVILFLIFAVIGVFIGMLARFINNNPLDFRERSSVSVIIVLCMIVLVCIEIGLLWKGFVIYCLTEEVAVTGIIAYHNRLQRMANGRRKSQRIDPL